MRKSEQDNGGLGTQGGVSRRRADFALLTQFDRLQQDGKRCAAGRPRPWTRASPKAMPTATLAVKRERRLPTRT